MPRKANTVNKIKVLTSKDKQVINMLSKTGQATYKQLKQLNGISSGRVQQLINSGYIKSSGSKYGKVYSITEKSHCIVNNGVYHKAGVEHDIKLTEQYLKLTEKQRELIKTGEVYAKEHGLECVGTPDIVIDYETEQQVEFIEVITINYKKEDIELKEQFKEQVNAKIKLVYTYKSEEVIK